MSARNTFRRQYAVLMPSGDLFPEHVYLTQPDDFSVPSPMRDMLSFMGVAGGTQTKTAVPTDRPAIFDRREDAAALCDQLRQCAAAVGVTNWGGEIVERLCTPFTTGRAADRFVSDIHVWLERNEMTS